MTRAHRRGSTPDRSKTPPVSWLRIDPSSDGYPWDMPALHPHNFPTPSMFVDLDEPGWFSIHSGFDELVRVTLGSALAMAGMDADLAMGSWKVSRQLRKQMRKTFFSKWHLALYGCTNENYCGGVHPLKPGGENRRAIVDHVMGEKGRGINLLPRHAENRALLAQGRPARRTTNLVGESLVGAPGYTRPLLWIPAIDLDRLKSAAPQVVLLAWEDGVSSAEPPTVIRRLGVQDPLALPGMPSLIDDQGG